MGESGTTVPTRVGDKHKHGEVDMSQIRLKAEDLYDNEKGDLKALEIPDIFQLLQCNEEGLSQKEADRRLEILGANKQECKDQNAFLQFSTFMWNPLSWIMEAAAIIAIVLISGQGMPPDWEDFCGIIFLLIMNAGVGLYKERKARKAIKSLHDFAIYKTKVKRNGQWEETAPGNLVPGDMVSFEIGDIIPADCRLTEATNVSIDQAALTGQSSPIQRHVGDGCFSGSVCKQGKAEAVVISTGANTFFAKAARIVGQGDDAEDHTAKMLAQLGAFCLVTVAVFAIVEILVMYGVLKYWRRRGLSDILVLIFGGVSIAMPTVLSVSLALGAQQVAKCKAIVTRLSAVKDLAAVSVLCADKVGTLTTNKLTIDRSTTKTYSRFSVEEVIQLAAFSCRTENQDPVDVYVTAALADPTKSREGIEILDLKPFNPVDGRSESTYMELSSGKIKRVTKGMAGIVIEQCTRNRTEDLEDALERDVEELALRGFRVLAVAYEEIIGDDPKGKGDGFEFIGLLAILDPPRDDAKHAVEDALSLGVHVKMVTPDRLAIAKEAGRRVGLGDHIYPARYLKDGPAPGAKHANVEEMILDAAGFAGVQPEHTDLIVRRLQALGHCVAVTGNTPADVPALLRANVGIAVKGACDAARSAADVVLDEPGLSSIVHAIRQSRISLQRMRSYSIYASAIAVRVVVCFAVLVFTYKFDFPPFMMLVIALLDVGFSMALSTDTVRPSDSPVVWDLPEIFSFAVAYGLYLAASTVALVVVIVETDFFQNTFGVELDLSTFPDIHDPQLHMIVYLQVSIISQALIFVTRAHGFFFMDRPSFALISAFAISQLVSNIIAVYGDWGFTDVQSISGTWIGIIWVWNIVWFIPLDWIKFAMNAIVVPYLHKLRVASAVEDVTTAAGVGPPRYRSRSRTQSSVLALTGSLYKNRTNYLRKPMSNVGGGLGGKVKIKEEEMRKFGAIQAREMGRTLAMHLRSDLNSKGHAGVDI